MFHKTIPLTTFVLLAFTASAQEKISLFDKKLNLLDTAPRATYKSPLIKVDSQLLARLPKFKAEPGSSVAVADAMPCVRPDMRYFNSFPVADPTKNPGYIKDNMPNSFQGRTSLSLKLEPVK